jgi:hypothetical protein
MHGDEMGEEGGIRKGQRFWDLLLDVGERKRDGRTGNKERGEVVGWL